MYRFHFEEPDVVEALANMEIEVRGKARLLLEAAGADTVSYLRSLTEEMQPPIRRSEGPRPAHPGGWADISGDLARGYGYDVHGTVDGAVLTLWNREDYAAAVEAHDGYYVLTGVTEPGGPLEDALRRIAPMLGLEVR